VYGVLYLVLAVALELLLVERRERADGQHQIRLEAFTPEAIDMFEMGLERKHAPLRVQLT
jgi:hypothetical protein